MKKIFVAMTFCLTTFSHGAMTQEQKISIAKQAAVECRALANFSILATDARQKSSMSKADFLKDTIQKFSTNGDLDLRKVLIEHAFSRPILGTLKEKEEEASKLAEKAYLNCMDISLENSGIYDD
jgi:hypothetical protein